MTPPDQQPPTGPRAAPDARPSARLGARLGPSTAGRLLIASGLLLLPWLIWLVITLPRHYSAHHYWLSWVGFDVALAASLVLTGRHQLSGDPRVTRTAAVATSLLAMDAWFDVLNAATTGDRLGAVALALLVELPLAVLTWRLTRRP